MLMLKHLAHSARAVRLLLVLAIIMYLCAPLRGPPEQCLCWSNGGLDADILDDALKEFGASPPTSEDSPWALFHALIGTGGDLPIVGGKTVLDWLLEETSWTSHPDAAVSPLIQCNENDVIFRSGEAFGAGSIVEGHFGQGLYAIVCAAGVDPSTQLVRVPPDGDRVPLAAMVRTLEWRAHSGAELSYAVPVFLVAGRTTWTNRFGESMSLDGVVQSLMHSEKTEVACFGTHWRIALAWADAAPSRVRLSAKTQRRVRTELDRELAEIRSVQGGDGMFNLSAVNQQGSSPAIGLEESVAFQAHSLEWIVVAIPGGSDHEWVDRAMAALIHHQKAGGERLSYGTRCHAARAIRLYRDRLCAEGKHASDPSHHRSTTDIAAPE
ncbi:MAG: hypothetical protein H7Y88_00035 [Phycisphaerales bacterium]|nr:hypothetical protein [Phycisphaerales bacterium]